jgi:hypothetical protein
MAVCCHKLTLGALSSRSALSLLVGALFEKFGFFLNTSYFPNTFFAFFGSVIYPGVYLCLLQIQIYSHAAQSHKLFFCLSVNLKPQRRKF